MEAGPAEKELLAAYEAYADALFRYCLYKTSDREVARDLVQETFVKLWNYLLSGKEIRSMRPFLYQLAGNLVIDWYRKHKTESLDNLMDQGFDPQNSSASPEVTAELSLVMRHLSKLSSDDRDLIIWRYIEDLSPKEIATILNEKENTVSVRIHRALERLRTHIQ